MARVVPRLRKTVSVLRRADAELVEVLEHRSWIGEHAICARALELLFAVPARQQAYAERARVLRGEHVPDAVADDGRALEIDADAISRGDEQIRIGLRVLDLVARDNRISVGRDAE